MALKATIFKADLQISDIDRDYYQTHKLTLARHPSETDERMMVRLLVFALQADAALEFTDDISADDAPALWQKSLSGEISRWIEIGLPDEKRIRKACRRARQVIIYCYGLRRARVWWQNLQDQLERFDNLSVFFVPDDSVTALAAMAQRTMQLTCLIQDGQLSLSDDLRQVDLVPEVWLQSLPAGRE